MGNLCLNSIPGFKINLSRMQVLLTMEVAAEDGLDGDVDQ
jgi:hypothetical protein